MSKGKRYETESHLNYQKVFAVIIALVVIAMFIFIVTKVIKQRKELSEPQEYFALYAENKWGVINQKGETIIAPTYQEMIVIPDKTKDVFICTYDIEEDTGNYKTKALNKKNEEILTQYEQIESLENIDQNNNMWYEKNILKVKQNGKYGTISLNGKQQIPCEYDEIETLKGIENSILLVKDGKYGLANNEGNILIETKYKEIKNLGTTYKEGYITIDENDKYGIISTTKKQILENKYDDIEQIYLSDYYVVTENGTKKLINSKGETLLEEGFDGIKSKTTRGIIFEKENQYGEMTTQGEVTIEAKYQELEQVKENIYIAKKDDAYGIIDENENTLLRFDYTGIAFNEKANIYIADDAQNNTSIIDTEYNVKLIGILSEINTEKSYIRMRIEDEYKYYDLSCTEKPNTEILKENTLFLSKKNGKYGYTDQKGNIVVDYIYDDATEQNEYGFVAVKQNGLWGSLNEKGEKIIEPKYNLEENLKVDFIGKWHLGQDLNMNYYCEK